MKRLPKSKQRIFARTVQRRKYSGMVDSHKQPPQSAVEAMKHKPYGMGEKEDDSERSNDIP